MKEHDERLNFLDEKIKNTKEKSEEISEQIEQIKKSQDYLKNLEKQTVQTYIQLQKVFRVAENIKILLLTATPMIDRGSEIIGIMNLILPKNQQLGKKDWQSPEKLKKAIISIRLLDIVEWQTIKSDM